MTKKHTESSLLTALDATSHLPIPVFPELKSKKRYVRIPSDIPEFVQLYNLRPIDLRNVELIETQYLYGIYLKHVGKNDVSKKNRNHFGRGMSECGIIRVRRTLNYVRLHFYIIEKKNLLQLIFEPYVQEGDNAKRQRQTIFSIERKKWENIPRFKKVSG